jgi:hypothetical protein
MIWRGTLAEQTSLFMCHPCDMDAPVQNAIRGESLDFAEIPQDDASPRIFARSGHAKTR